MVCFSKVAFCWEPDEEYHAQYGLEMINTSEAYKLGLTGKGITIGVVDSGVDARHSEFIQRGVEAAYPYYLSDLVDSKGHGSHVAGIIGAAKNGEGMHGVAFDSSLISAASCGFEIDFVQLLTERPEVSIVNNSWGFGQPITQVAKDDLSFLQKDLVDHAVSSNSLIICATGNYWENQVDLLAGMPYLFPDLQSRWLAVVAVNKDQSIAEYSNRAGVAAEWTIAAPGGDYYDDDGQLPNGIYSVQTGGEYTKKSGTSMAAPHVSGAAALVWQAFPYFTSEQIAQTLLTTATDLGESGVDPVYGHGLLNVGKAIKGPAQFNNSFLVDIPTSFSTFSNDISGSGGLTKKGAGALNLTGSNTYTGDTSIEQGTLYVNGSLLSPVTVQSAGTLRGTGNINASVNIYGTLSPGNSPGTLNVTGNVTQQPNSIYSPEIAGINSYSIINLLGNNSVYTADGVLAPQLLNNYQPALGCNYLIVLTEGSINGNYNTITNPLNLPTGLTFDVLYNQQNIQLSTTPADYGDTSLLGWNSNQAAIAQIWQQQRPAHGVLLTAEQKDLYQALFPLDLYQLKSAASQMSGQIIVDSQASALDQIRNLNQNLGEMIKENTQVKILQNNLDVSDGDLPGRKVNGNGVIINHELKQEKNLRIGLGVEYIKGRVTSKSAPGTANTESYGLHFYTHYQPADWYLQSQIGIGQTTQRHDRYLKLPTAQGSVYGEAKGDHLFARIALGTEKSSYQQKHGLTGALLYESIYRGAMTESGDNLLTVSSDSIRTNRLASELFFTHTNTWDVAKDISMSLNTKLGWVHDFSGLDSKANLSWRNIPLDVRSEKLGADAVQYGLGIGWQWKDGYQFKISATGENRKNSKQTAINAALEYKW